MSRLKQLISALEMTQVEFAEKMGIAKSTVSDVISGRLKDLPNHVHITLVRAYNVNLNWLLTGEGEMFIQPKMQGVTQGDDSINISGGNNITVNKNNYYLNDEEIRLMEEIRKSSKEKVIQAMLKALKGSIVIIAIYAVYEAVREMPGLEGTEQRTEVRAGGKV